MHVYFHAAAPVSSKLFKLKQPYDMSSVFPEYVAGWPYCTTVNKSLSSPCWDLICRGVVLSQSNYKYLTLDVELSNSTRPTFRPHHLEFDFTLYLVVLDLKHFSNFCGLFGTSPCPVGWPLFGGR